MKAANAAAFHPSGPQPTCLSTPLTTPASVGPSAAAYVLLDTCLAGWRLSQESKDTWPHPDPDRERPSASLVYEERDPEYENYGCWNEWVCTCFAPVLQATSVTRDTKSETEEE